MAAPMITNQVTFPTAT